MILIVMQDDSPDYIINHEDAVDIKDAIYEGRSPNGIESEFDVLFQMKSNYILIS